MEVLPKIRDFIIELGDSLDKEKYKEIEKNIWIGNNVTIDKLSTIIAPCIIDEESEIRPVAYLRGSVIVGKKCVIGNSVEIKNVEKKLNGKGRVVVRPSGTEPLIRVMIEGEQIDEIKSAASSLALIIENTLN